MNKLLLIFLFVVAINASAQDNEFHLDEVYSFGSAGTIDLSSSDADVFITGSDRKDIHVKIHRVIEVDGMEWGDNDFDVEITESNGDLKIKEYNNGSVMIIGSISEKYEIWIDAPSHASLDIYGDDGDYSLKNINGNIALDIDDGDVNLANCGGNNFKFDVDDGDITMDKGNGLLIADMDDSDLSIKNASFNSIDVQTDDGDIYIETTLVDNGDYSFDSDDSSVELIILGGGGEFNISHDDGSVRVSDAFSIIKEREYETQVKLSKGNALVNFDTDDGSVLLSTN